MPRRRSEEKRQQKRQHILSAARSIFLEKGYSETTMAEIAKAASMPVSSLYNYFQNKEAIFRQLGLQEDVYNRRPKHDRRRKAILDVALKLMGQAGYSSVTLDEIAARLNMPKASFYQYFDSKEELFSTLLTESPLQESAYELMPNDKGKSCADGLRSIGQSYLDMGNIPERTAIFRMALHESNDHPEAGRLFYSEGISKVCDTLAQYLEGCVKSPKRTRKEWKLAAWIYLSSLWASNILFKVIRGTERDFSDQEILDMSVDIFTAWLEKQAGEICTARQNGEPE